MDDFLRDLALAYDLRTIGINLFCEPHTHFAVYMHWNDGADTECCSGSGKTVDEAMIVAVREMVQRRYLNRGKAA